MPESMLTIVFRGLMVFHRQGTGAGSRFEVGILRGPNHIPRINVIKNWILDAVARLDVVNTGRAWRLDVTNPVQQGVDIYTQGANFDRKNHSDERDYRWLIDLENNTEFYGPLHGKINTAHLRPVLRVSNGLFYTRLKSHRVNRQKDGSGVQDFGYISAAVGCDIRIQQGSIAKLIDTSTGLEVFRFNDEANTIYEIVNTPPDTTTGTHDHFQHYYDIMDPSLPRYRFSPPGPPAPSPALCGEVGLGQYPNDL